MTKDKAFKILGLAGNSSLEDCKKRYRTLMLMTHPDMNEDHDYPYEASEINVAYEYLLHLAMDNAINGGAKQLTAHKLYVKNELGKEIGYISFKDDRLYYGIIPLLERRRALIKMVVKDARLRRLNQRKYMDVTMYLKLEQENREMMIDSINLKIDQLLER